MEKVIAHLMFYTCPYCKLFKCNSRSVVLLHTIYCSKNYKSSLQPFTLIALGYKLPLNSRDFVKIDCLLSFFNSLLHIFSYFSFVIVLNGHEVKGNFDKINLTITDGIKRCLIFDLQKYGDLEVYGYKPYEYQSYPIYPY